MILFILPPFLIKLFCPATDMCYAYEDSLSKGEIWASDSVRLITFFAGMHLKDWYFLTRLMCW